MFKHGCHGYQLFILCLTWLQDDDEHWMFSSHHEDALPINNLQQNNRNYSQKGMRSDQVQRDLIQTVFDLNGYKQNQNRVSRFLIT